MAMGSGKRSFDWIKGNENHSENFAHLPSHSLPKRVKPLTVIHPQNTFNNPIQNRPGSKIGPQSVIYASNRQPDLQRMTENKLGPRNVQPRVAKQLRYDNGSDFDFDMNDDLPHPQRSTKSTIRPGLPVTNRPVGSQPATSVQGSSQSKANKMERLKMLTGTVGKVLQWSKLIVSKQVLFEVIGTIDYIREGTYQMEKILLMRDSLSESVLQVVFFEIDRPLNELPPGSIVKVVGTMKSRSRLQAFSVRRISAEEQVAAQRVIFICDRIAHENVSH